MAFRRASVQFIDNRTVFQYENWEQFTVDQVAVIISNELDDVKRYHLASLSRHIRDSSLGSLKAAAPNADLSLKQEVDLAIFGCDLLLLPTLVSLNPSYKRFIDEEKRRLQWLAGNLQELQEPQYRHFVHQLRNEVAQCSKHCEACKEEGWCKDQQPWKEQLLLSLGLIRGYVME